MQLKLFDKSGAPNTPKNETKRAPNTTKTEKTNARKQKTKKALATVLGLEQFVDGENIDIQTMWDKGYIDEIKGLFAYMIRDLKGYKGYRKNYTEEVTQCREILKLNYFDDSDIGDIEKFLWSIQKYFKENPIVVDTIFDKATQNKYIRKVKNEYIKGIFKENIDALGRVGEKVDEKSRIGLIISLYPSFTGSKKQLLTERQLRYNRLFFQHQLEHKKIYYPHGRKEKTINMTEADSLFDNLGSAS